MTPRKCQAGPWNAIFRVPFALVFSRTARRYFRPGPLHRARRFSLAMSGRGTTAGIAPTTASGHFDETTGKTEIIQQFSTDSPIFFGIILFCNILSRVTSRVH